MTGGDVRAAFDAMLRRKAGIEPHDPGDPGDEPEDLTVARLPTERERVGAELVAYRDRDHGDPEWHVDLVDRDVHDTIVSLTLGQAMLVRAQMDVAIRAGQRIRDGAGD